MNIPDWYEVILLSLASWRVFQLIAFDSILDQPRRYVTRLGRKWEKEGDVIPKEYREKWALFLTCPYCLGFHLSLAVYLFWVWFPTETLIVSTVCVLNAGVVAGNKILGSEE